MQDPRAAGEAGVATVIYSPDPHFGSAIAASLPPEFRPVRADHLVALVSSVALEVYRVAILHLDSLEHTETISEIAANAAVLVVGPDDEEHMLTAIESGALGYALEDDPLEQIGGAVRVVGDGKAVVPPLMLGAVLRAVVHRRRQSREAMQRLAQLTPREREVFELVVSGRNRREIARELVISPETVRTHIQRLMRKLDLHSTTEVVALGGQVGAWPTGGSHV